MKRAFFVIFLTAVSFFLAFFLCTKIIPEDFWPAAVTMLDGGESFTVISIDPETELQLVWAYEAEVKQSQRMELENYRRNGDISFKRMQTTGNWSFSPEGYLRTDEDGAQFRFPYPKLTGSVFVFCLRTTGGDAIIRHDFPGGHTFTRIEGRNKDAMPVSSAAVSSHPWKITQLAGMILIGLTLSAISVFLFLRWTDAHPLSEPEPQKGLSVRTSPVFYAAAFLVPFFMALIVCWLNGFAPFGSKTFLYNDMSNQNYRFFLYLKNMPKEHNDFIYSFSKTLGGTMLNFSPYYLCDLLIYLIFLFPEAQIPAYCTFLILLHLGCSGLTAFIYLRKSGRSLPSSLLFSWAYALMAFNIVCADNPYFLTGTIFLPLVMLGLEREIRQREPLLYILALAAALFSNFYFGWMVCIFSLIWFVYIEISENRRTIFSDFISFLLHSLLSVGLIMAVLLPLAASLGGNQKDFSMGRLLPELLSTGTGLLSKLFTASFNHAQITTVKEGLPSVFCGTLTTVFAFLWFFRKGRTNRARFSALGVLAVFLLSFSVSTPYLIWHAFNYPLCWPDRFAFAFGFFLIYLASDAFDKRDDFSLTGLFAVFALFSVICLVVFKTGPDYLSPGMILMDWCITLVSLLWILFYSTGRLVLHQGFPLIAALLLLPDLYLNTAHIWNISYLETLGDSGISAETYQTEYRDVSIPVHAIKNADNDFYRFEFAVRDGDNQGFRFSTNTVSHYSSTNDLESMLFLDRMGISATYTGKSNYRYGSTMTADALLGIKYTGSKPDLAVKPYPVLEQNETMVFQVNQNALSLGMAASPDILGVRLEGNKPFSNQEMLLTAITGRPVSLFTPVTDLSLETDNLTSAVLPQYTEWKKELPEQPGTLTWNMVSGREEMLYAWFPVLSQRTGYVSVNGRQIGRTIDPRNYGVIPLGIFPAGTDISVSLQFDAESIALFDAVFMYEDRKPVGDLFNGTISQMTDIVKHSSSHLEGDIISDKEGQWLFLTLPYSDEWNFLVNGKRVAAEKVVDALMAVPLVPGENHIEMRFIPRGFLPGLCISVCSLLFIVFSERKKVKK